MRSSLHRVRKLPGSNPSLGLEAGAAAGVAVGVAAGAAAAAGGSLPASAAAIEEAPGSPARLARVDALPRQRCHLFLFPRA